MFRIRSILLLASSLWLGLGAVPCSACPMIEGLVDFNCDGKHRIVVTGDSLAFGRGDELNENQGGYALRLRAAFPKSSVVRLGFPGITSSRLLGTFKKLFRKAPDGRSALQFGTADMVIIDVGRNDFFNRNPATLTVTTHKRLVKFLAQELKALFETSPLFVTTLLTPTTRPLQAPFITEVNEILLETRSAALPAYLRFDFLAPEFISTDGIHPSSAGYDVLTELAREYISDDAQERSETLRKDRDLDDVYDLFEVLKYFTDPRFKDTDGDEFTDGHEIFKSKTDPNDPLSKPVGAPPASTPTAVATGTSTVVPTATATPTPTVTPSAGP